MTRLTVNPRNVGYTEVTRTRIREIEANRRGTWAINAVDSMGRRNTQLAPILH